MPPSPDCDASTPAWAPYISRRASAMLALASAFSLPVTSSFLRMDRVTDKLVAVPDEITRVRIVPLVAGFLLLSATAHLILASPRAHGWYERRVRSGINPARWVEYAFSSSLMIVVIAMLAGIYDIAAFSLLVPGALGLIGITALVGNNTEAGRANLGTALAAIPSVAPGILAGTMIVREGRTVVRSRRRRRRVHNHRDLGQGHRAPS